MRWISAEALLVIKFDLCFKRRINGNSIGRSEFEMQFSMEKSQVIVSEKWFASPWFIKATYTAFQAAFSKGPHTSSSETGMSIISGKLPTIGPSSLRLNANDVHLVFIFPPSMVYHVNQMDKKK